MMIMTKLKEAAALLEGIRPMGSDALIFGTALKNVKDVVAALEEAARQELKKRQAELDKRAGEMKQKEEAAHDNQA